MQTNLLWTGREYYSLENCLVDISEDGIEITSCILGAYRGRVYKVEYHIEANRNWETVLLEIYSRHSDTAEFIRLESDGKGSWTSNGKNALGLKDCIDVDISLTPFTNTLPINRLHLEQNSSKEIQVVYCDLLARQIKPVRQKYTCLSKTEYRYQNVPNDFEATIHVDDSGFVVDYPSLFVRTAALRSNYS